MPRLHIPFDGPQDSPLTARAIRELGVQLRATLLEAVRDEPSLSQFHNDNPLTGRAIILASGGHLVRAERESDEIWLEAWALGDFTVYGENDFLTPPSQSYLATLGFASYMLHAAPHLLPGCGIQVAKRGNGRFALTDRQRREAALLAFELLMPEEAMGKYFAPYDQSAAMIYFGAVAPRDIILQRAKQLGLTADAAA